MGGGDRRRFLSRRCDTQSRPMDHFQWSHGIKDRVKVGQMYSQLIDRPGAGAGEKGADPIIGDFKRNVPAHAAQTIYYAYIGIYKTLLVLSGHSHI